MARRIARTNALTPGFEWRSRDDVVAAVQALRGEALPEVHIVPEPGHPTGNVDRAFRRAYSSHPVVVAAETWSRDEIRTERSFRVFCALVDLHVRAARRWRAEQAEPAPF